MLSALGGTLFLDEICEMDLALQTKLLRFLQTLTVQRLGEDLVRPADVRIVCATNKDPWAEVAAGRLREDLFYRLHVIPVEMPPLRDRGDDVLMIARAFLARFRTRKARHSRAFPPRPKRPWSAIAGQAMSASFRMSSATLSCCRRARRRSRRSSSRDPARGRRPIGQAVVASLHPGAGAISPTTKTAGRSQSLVPLDDAIRQHIEAAIALCDGSIPRAAAILEVAPSTIYRRIEAWQAADALKAAPQH